MSGMEKNYIKKDTNVNVQNCVLIAGKLEIKVL